MVDLVEAASRLQRACVSANGFVGAFRPASRMEIASLGSLSIGPEIDLWFTTASPRHASIPWVVSELLLAGVDTLVDMQAGYAWDARTGITCENWSASWIVIGQIDGDPFVADTSKPGTPVLAARHGTGAWRMVTLANDLASFLTAITTWVEIAVVEHRGVLLNERSEFDESVLDALQRSWRTQLSVERAAHLMDFVIG